MKVEGRRITRVRGNKDHVASHGYACEKAQRIDYYQSGKDRLDSPMRRRADGSFEKIDWDTAIAEVAARLVRVRDEFGGASIFYYGGGGQGNHLCGAYSTATRRALGAVYASNALAQEKTGEFWVEGRLTGGRPSPDFEHAEVAVFVGKNPWQSHGFQSARPTLRKISADPNRALIVIDPRRTETAELADYHLQVRPGTDAFCLSAILAVMVQEDLHRARFSARACDRRRRSLRRAPAGSDRGLLRTRGTDGGSGARGGAANRARDRRRLGARGSRHRDVAA